MAPDIASALVTDRALIALVILSGLAVLTLCAASAISAFFNEDEP